MFDKPTIAFEQFLGTTFRGELGQFFTPRTVVDFMTEILDPQENEIICDPTCGSGGFLIKAFEYIREQVEEDIRTEKERLRIELEGTNFDDLSEKEQLSINGQIEQMQNALNRELDTSVEQSRMYKISRNCIYGTDANPRMARTSKMNMIMHGDGHGGVHHHDGLLNVNGIFEGRFDIILTNPPFGQNVDKNQIITDADKFTDEEMKIKYRKKYGMAYDEALQQVDENIDKKLLSLYDLGSISTLTEVLFMERCLRLLKKGGRMGIVLPEGVLNNKNLQAVREYFEGRAKLILICSIPQDVFIAAGATVKPSLVFMRKFTAEEELEYAKCKAEAETEARIMHKEEIDNLDARYNTCVRLEEALKLDLKDAGSRLRKVQKAQPNDVAKIESEINMIKEQQRNNTIEKKCIQKEQIELEKQIIEDSKPIIKQKFAYDVPIAKIDDAGITTTGAESEGNQLPNLLAEYSKYRKENNLWEEHKVLYTYAIKNNSYFRIWNGQEVKLNG